MHKKVLIADDDFHINRVIAYKIKSAGYEVLTARNGQEAVDIARREKPDIIVMDIMMPVITGIQAAEILKQDTDMANIPIIILTAMEVGEDEENITTIAGSGNIITKPFSPKELLNAIRVRIGEA
jgi:DNA-binding response OmpR family regulator